ncbi:hypothetical protein AB0M34_04950 [Nocardia sp. NPDC050193]
MLTEHAPGIVIAPTAAFGGQPGLERRQLLLRRLGDPGEFR